MLGFVKNIVSNCYYYAKQILSVLWHGYNFEGEVAVKALSIGYKTYQGNHVEDEIRTAITSLKNHVAEHQKQSLAVAVVVLARYASPLSAGKACEIGLKGVQAILQQLQLDVDIATKLISIYESTASSLNSDLTQKYLTKLSNTVSENMGHLAHKMAARLQDIQYYENYFLESVFSRIPSDWVTQLKKSAEVRNINFNAAISAFKSLGETPSSQLLTQALAEFEKLNQSMIKLLEFFHEIKMNLPEELMAASVNYVAQATRTKQILERLGGWQLPSNTVIAGMSTIVNTTRSMYQYAMGEPVAPVVQEEPPRQAMRMGR